MQHHISDPSESPNYNGDVPIGKLHNVWLPVDPHRHNYGRRATLCESLFGIVPGHFTSPQENAASISKEELDTRVAVQVCIKIVNLLMKTSFK